ncbi:MAG: lysoplasmalogenase family protein [Candidatus Coproplasma sp.]
MTEKKLNVKSLIFLVFIAVEAVIYIIFNVLAAVGTPDPVYLKYAGVLLCLAVLLAVLLMPGSSRDNAVMLAALFFTAISDLFILVLDKYYEVGLVTFIIVQTLYLYRLYADRLKKVFITLGVRIGVMVAIIITFAALGKLNLLVAECAIYITMLVCNVADAFIVCRKGVKDLLFAIGLLLFLGCDICVGLHNLGSVLGVTLPGWLVQFVSVAIWAFYLPSQVLITLSVNKGGLRLMQEIKGEEDVAQG